MAGFTIFETTISFTKSILVSVGVFSTVILFKAAPIIPKLATLPRLWASPLYVFIVFNLIMFALVASSAFRRQKDTIFHHVPAPPPNCFYYNSSQMISNQLDQVLQQELGPSTPCSSLCAYSSDKDDEDAGGDSMDAMWKAIVESKEKQTPQLMKKSQTWDSSPPPRPRLIRADHADEEDKEEEPVKKKSDRFHQTMSLRRKISMTSEELKSRAEAFIEMVNRSIRLQRQQSEQRFLQAMKHSV